MAEYSRIRDERRAYEHRLSIIDTDPNAPICINCRHCQQSGFLFCCPIYALPEDGKVVGMFGIVYYRRKGHKPITYPDAPMKSEECEAFKKSVPAAATLNGKAIHVEPVKINGAETLTLKALAKAYHKMYAKVEEEAKKGEG